MDMATVEVQKEDFSRILHTAEELVNEVESALSQDETAKRRMNDIKSGKVKGKTESELDSYLKSRGVKVD